MRSFLRIEISEGLNFFQELLLRWLLPKLVGWMSYPLFLVECRRKVGSPLEGIFFRINDGRKEVLLRRRPDDKVKDPFYAGKLDVFGTTILASDVLPQSDVGWQTNCYRKPLQRILAEAGLTKFRSKPRVITTRLFMGARGPVNQTIVLCAVPEDETPIGEWYPVNALPNDLVREHRSLINLAAKFM